MSESDGKEVHEIAVTLDGDQLLGFMRRVHQMAYTRGCGAGYFDAIQALGRKIKGLEEELASKSNDAYVMGEISALAQFSTTLKDGCESADECASGQLETFAAWCQENNAMPLLAVFARAILQRKGEPAAS